MKHGLAEAFPRSKEPPEAAQEAGPVTIEKTPADLREEGSLVLMEKYAEGHRRSRSFDSDTEEEIMDPVREYRTIARDNRSSRRSVSPMLSYPSEFIEKHVEGKERRDLLREVPLQEALQQERYDLVASALAQQTSLERMYTRVRAGALPQLFRAFDATAQKLVNDGRPRAANELMKAREIMLGSRSVSAETRSLVEEAATHGADLIPRQRLDRSEGQESISVPDSMIRFYADEYIRIALDTIKRSRDFDSRAPTTLKLAMARLEESTQLRARALIDRVRQYLIYAVLTELNYQNEKGLPYLSAELKSVSLEAHQNLFTGILIDREDVLGFFRAARSRFMRAFGNRTHFGGKAWAQIANVGYDAWKTEDFNTLVTSMDRVFQLEHNTGTVLNKDHDSLRNPHLGKDVLDAKFAATSLADLLTRTKQFIVDKRDDPRDTELGKVLEDRIRDMESILRLSSTYFPEETAKARDVLKTKPDFIENLKEA